MKRRRWPELLSLPFALALAPLGGALAEPSQLAPATCAEGAAHEVYIDDEPQPRCEILFGGLEEREKNAAWRERRISAIESSSLTLDIVHSDARLKRPQLRSLPGMVIVETFPATLLERRCGLEEDEQLLESAAEVEAVEHEVVVDAEADEELADELDAAEDAAEEVEERVALVHLDEPWAQLCGQGSILLRTDDAIGASGRVLYIGRRGVLAHLSGRLVWLSRMGASVPTFRNTWQSGFSVITETPAKPAPKKKKPRKKRRRR